jgi:hypothetical protein
MSYGCICDIKKIGIEVSSRRIKMEFEKQYDEFGAVERTASRIGGVSDVVGKGSASVSNGSKFPGQFRVRFQLGTEPLQWVATQNLLLKSQHFLLQLSI